MTFSFKNAANELRLPLASENSEGLRHAQVAAAHAIAAHFWSAPGRPALVVMPTGSGKTAVMILASLLLRPARVLVVAPSRLLRDQLVESFQELAPLRKIGALDAKFNGPTVVARTNRITNASEWNELKSADIVVALPHSVSPGVEGVAEPPPDLFDLVLVDEAHHAPAPIYKALSDAFPAARKVLFTATPFRRDEREIPGDLVFTYHLGQAKRDGVFGQLQFVPVTVEPNASQAVRDETIARAAASRLVADRKSGLDHRVFVRTSSVERADELAVLYGRETSLKLRRVHSGLSAKYVRDAIADLRSGSLDGIIAVDMLGEGFDLPSLKVAALHAQHRSLAVTLQFIGRFARTSKSTNLGEATFFAIPDEIERNAKGLYVPGAEWNELVDVLSREEIEDEADARSFVQTFARRDSADHNTDDEHSDLSDDDARRLLRTIKPYFHVKVYDAHHRPDLGAELVVPRNLKALLVRQSAEHNAVLWLGRQSTRPRWTTNENWIDVRHDMFFIVYVPEHSMLFIFASRRQAEVYDALVKSVLGEGGYRRLSTSEVNRVLRDIDSAEFFSLGMRNRAGTGGAGAESYRTVSGRAADRIVRAADSAIYSQGHGFCRGEERGVSVTVGFSSSSKIWANRYDGLDVFVHWMRAIAAKVRQTGPLVTGSGIDRLAAPTRIDFFSSAVIDADLPSIAYERSGVVVRSNASEDFFADLSIAINAQTSHSVSFSLVGLRITLPFSLDLGSNPLITPMNANSQSSMVIGGDGDEDSLTSFLNQHPVVLYLENLARIDGDEQHEPPGRGPCEAISKQIVPRDWSALSVDPYREKPLLGRPNLSLFEYVESATSSAEVIFLDDGANEIADYVSIESEENRVVVRVFHCKAAARGSNVPNQSISNLYEVIGQAVKCRRFLQCQRLLDQFARRQQLANCGFKKGDLATAGRLLRNPSRVVFQIVVVQPALSTTPSEPIARLLEAADGYMRGADLDPLVFWGTAPLKKDP